jgi:CHASE3 domain sensor protein
MAVRKGNFTVVDIAALAPSRKERKLTPRQIEALARQKIIIDLLNDAATQPASKAVAWDFGKQSPANVRNALKRVAEREPRNLYAAVRGSTLYASKAKLPGRSTNLSGKS